VTAVGLLTIAQLLLLATGGQHYQQAHDTAVENDQPLLVLIGGDWCPGCAVMKKRVLLQLERQKQTIQFANVDINRQRSLATKIANSTKIPRLVMYRQSVSGWKRWELAGVQSTEALEGFLRRGGSSVDRADGSYVAALPDSGSQ